MAVSAVAQGARASPTRRARRGDPSATPTRGRLRGECSRRVLTLGEVARCATTSPSATGCGPATGRWPGRSRGSAADRTSALYSVTRTRSSYRAPLLIASAYSARSAPVNPRSAASAAARSSGTISSTARGGQARRTPAGTGRRTGRWGRLVWHGRAWRVPCGRGSPCPGSTPRAVLPDRARVMTLSHGRGRSRRCRAAWWVWRGRADDGQRDPQTFTHAAGTGEDADGRR